MPKPPKFGMVIAPKTEHGMKSRFKCKDGWVLASPTGKELTSDNDYVLTCSFGNWTGETPICQEGTFFEKRGRNLWRNFNFETLSMIFGYFLQIPYYIALHYFKRSPSLFQCYIFSILSISWIYSKWKGASGREYGSLRL